MKKSASGSSLADWQTRIRNSGLRSTAARVAVLQALEHWSTPATHAELAEKLVPLGFDKATVYRNLMDLSEAGLVSRSELGDHVWRFELRREGANHTGEHPHFLCVDCGEVSCLDDVNISITPAPGSKSAIDVTEVLLKGHCDRCKDD